MQMNDKENQSENYKASDLLLQVQEVHFITKETNYIDAYLLYATKEK